VIAVGSGSTSEEFSLPRSCRLRRLRIVLRAREVRKIRDRSATVHSCHTPLAWTVQRTRVFAKPVSRDIFIVLISRVLLTGGSHAARSRGLSTETAQKHLGVLRAQY